jgi:drug/metabolite transporter (DMT)-like permease
MKQSQEWQGMLLGFLGVAAFGLTLPVTRTIVPYMDPLFIGFGRATVAAVVAAFLLWQQKVPLPDSKQCMQLVAVSLGVVIGFPVLSSVAMQTVHASHGAVVLGLLPLATALVAVFVSHEKPSIGFWLMSILGSAVVVRFVLGGVETQISIGDIALLAAVFCAAVGYAVGGTLSRTLGGWQVICWALVFASPFTLIPAIWYMPEIQSVPQAAWMGFLYLALVSQLFGFFLWNKGLAMGGVARVSQLQLLQVFITLFVAYIFLNEPLSTRTWLYGLGVVAIVGIGKSMPVARLDNAKSQ